MNPSHTGYIIRLLYVALGGLVVVHILGTVGYMVSGYGATNLPEGAFGFIYLPALAATVVVSMLVAPLGAKLAHSLPVPMVKKIFAGLLILLLAKMLHGLLL